MVIDISRYLCRKGHWSYELERFINWTDLHRDVQLKSLKYLRLMCMFAAGHELTSFEEKRWLLENATTDTTIIPPHYFEEFTATARKALEGAKKIPRTDN